VTGRQPVRIASPAMKKKWKKGPQQNPHLRCIKPNNSLT